MLFLKATPKAEGGGMLSNETRTT